MEIIKSDDHDFEQFLQTKDNLLNEDFNILRLEDCDKCMICNFIHEESRCKLVLNVPNKHKLIGVYQAEYVKK